MVPHSWHLRAIDRSATEAGAGQQTFTTPGGGDGNELAPVAKHRIANPVVEAAGGAYLALCCAACAEGVARQRSGTREVARRERRPSTPVREDYEARVHERVHRLALQRAGRQATDDTRCRSAKRTMTGVTATDA
jgi:hypothetical protein